MKQIRENNDNHDERGRFASGSGGASGLRFVQHPNASSRSDVTVMVPTHALDAAWRKGLGELYIDSHGRGAIEGRRERFEKFLATGEPVQAPKITVDKAGAVIFSDGRHRFAVLRDRGVSNVAVTIARKDLPLLKAHVGDFKPLPKPGRVIENVAVLGPISKNNRRYSLAARQDLAKLLQIPRWVFSQHAAQGWDAARCPSEAVAILENGRIDEQGIVRADLRFREQHDGPQEILEAIADTPERFALSPALTISGAKMRDGEFIVDNVLDCYSVDIVPAAQAGCNRTLFESHVTLTEGVKVMSTTTLSPPRSRAVELREYAAQQKSPVDRKAGVIKDVRVIGKVSRNNREYSDRALDRIAELAEGADVNVDHPEDRNAGADRPLASKFGVLRNSRRTADGVRADLHFLKSHPMAEQVCESAGRMPKNFGLSINANGPVSQVGGKNIVGDIDVLRSVDLVSKPATNDGLFESERRRPTVSLQEAFHSRPSAKDAFLEACTREGDDDVEESDSDLSAQIAAILAGDGTDDEKTVAIIALFDEGDSQDATAVAEDDDDMTESAALPDDPMVQERAFRRALGMPDRSWGAFGGGTGGSAGPELSGAADAGAGQRGTEVVAAGGSGGSARGPGAKLESFIESINPHRFNGGLEDFFRARDASLLETDTSSTATLPRCTADLARAIR